MKLIITGATGFVATEVLRQALLHPSIKSVVALARSSVSPPVGTSAAYASKLKSVVVKDYATYPEDVKKELAGADACIWTVAITPGNARPLPAETVHEVCQEWAIAGFKAVLNAGPSPAQPLRFLYMSGSASADPAHPHKKDTKSSWMPKFMVEYLKMRGETHTRLFNLAAENKGRVEVCVAKPGLITGGQGGILRGLLSTALSLSGVVDTIDIKEVSAAMLHCAVRGFEDTEGVLTNAEMVKLGRELLTANEQK